MSYKKYGWFSVQQAEIAGTHYWMSANGNKIELTVISSDPFDSGCSFDDMVPLGEVVGTSLGKASKGKVDLLEEKYKGREDDAKWREMGNELLSLIKTMDQKQKHPHRWN